MSKRKRPIELLRLQVEEFVNSTFGSSRKLNDS